MKFLNMKLIQVKDIQSRRRVLREKEKDEGRNIKSRKKLGRFVDKK